MADLSGIYIATCTPFAADESFDDGAFKAHLDSLIEAGADGIVFCGGTGEFAFLSNEERRHIIEVGTRHVQGRAGIIVNTSAIRESDGINWARHAQDLGADAVMVLPPYFEGPGESGVMRFYEAINNAIDTEIMLYNIPVHSGFDIDAQLYRRLLELDNVGSIKDSTGDLVRQLELLEVGGKVFNGCDPLAFYAMSAGVTGCIWGGANAMAAECSRLWRLVQAGDLYEARALWKKMEPLNLYFWLNEYNPSVKWATNLRSTSVGECRMPVLPPTEEAVDEIRQRLALLD
ncbi:dihydrodipicolinate synthase family protein [Zobellella aerophila]|uniref:Dihydrodipicolinate synthase family protein n=1 Tax=Zobellella aerophila TaxID=870480 RepID=A0ABP6WD02_9GAMM